MSVVAKKLGALVWPSKPRSNYTYSISDCNSADVDELGITGAGLCTIKRLKFSCPPGFIIGTTAFRIFNSVSNNSSTLPVGLLDECTLKINDIAQEVGLTFKLDGDEWPLLVAVRCGTTLIAPDLCYSILNVGMSEKVCKRLELWSKNQWFALNTYANFLYSFGVHIMHVSPAKYEVIVLQHTSNGIDEFNFPVDVLQKIIAEMKNIVTIPEEPYEQIKLVILTMYADWNARCQLHFQEFTQNEIFPAITIQAMVLGNFNDNSGSGVLFSRDPVTGASGVHGEYIYQLAGSGLSEGTELTHSVTMLHKLHPDLCEMLQAVVLLLELEYREVQRTEFVVQDGKYYILGTQTATRSALANMKILVDMVQEKLITRTEALLRVDPSQLQADNQFITVDPTSDTLLSSFGHGTTASTGLVSGALAFCRADIHSLLDGNNKIIMVCRDMKVHDQEEMLFSSGIISVHGGTGSRGSILARQYNIPTIVGVGQSGITLDETGSSLSNRDGICVKKGQLVTMDGSTGKIFQGIIPSVPIASNESFKVISDWVQDMKKVEVMSDVRNIDELQSALYHCADGIGIYRLDDLFMSPESYCLDQLRLLLMSRGKDDQVKHRGLLTDAISTHMVKVVGLKPGKPLYIKLLAPSLCSRLCINSAQAVEFCLRNTLTAEELEEKYKTIVRIGCQEHYFVEAKWFSFLQKDTDISQYPTQPCSEPHICDACRSFMSSPVVVTSIVNGIVDAVKLIQQKIPEAISSIELLVSDSFGDDEIDSITTAIASTENYNLDVTTGSAVHCNIGLHVQTPKSCLALGHITRRHDMKFVIFDTDHLTELAYGLFRTDKAHNHPSAGNYFHFKAQIKDPFVFIDEVGVGHLIEIGINDCRRTNSSFIIGVQGEHTKNLESVEYFCRIGVEFLVVSDLQAINAVKIKCCQCAIEASLENELDVDTYYSKLKV